MASEVAQAPSAPNQQQDLATDHAPTSNSPQETQVNGVDASEANASGFSGNATLPATEIDVSAKPPPVSSTPDANPAGPTPVDDAAPGIQPVADFIPKEASTLSHPTPPPDEPLNAGFSEVDAEMADAENQASPPDASETATPAQPEASLVRPREDDGEDEPAAKRVRVDEEVTAPAQAVDASVPAAVEAGETDAMDVATDGALQPSAEAEQASELPSKPADQNAPAESMDTIVSKASPTDDVPADAVPTSAVPMESGATDIKAEAGQTDVQSPSAAPPATETANIQTTLPESQPLTTSDDAKPADPSTTVPAPAPAPAQADGEPTAAVSGDSATVQFSTEPMTPYQKLTLGEKMKNLKKTKHSVAFLRPVDPVALNIPTYFDVIKQPMDLSTMETKLKNGEYATVKDFADDFGLIVKNSEIFNGPNHLVTVAAHNMKAYFDKMMMSVPSPSQQAPTKKKHRSPSIAQEPKRREARAAAVQPPAPAPAPAAAPAPAQQQQQSFALQSDGTPQIRRASSNVRPARAIKPPQNREIPYAKPKRKEHLLELKFAEHVLDEIRSAKYQQFNHVFQYPVDPVALNIPNYHQIIKHPMDLSTMVQKMKSGQYGTAVEFKKDFELMIKNCMTFNPVGNPVRDLAVGLQRHFDDLWKKKGEWEKRNAPASTRASSASAEAESDEEDEEDDEGGGTEDATVAALKKQIAAMQSTLESLSGAGAVGKTNNKPAKSHKKGAAKKAGGAAPAANVRPAPKPAKPKKERMITYEEKDEISKAVERMDEKQIGKLTEIITRECPKYRDMEEMELEIDDLPNSVQLLLLHYVRGIFGNPNRKKSAAARDYSPDDVAAQDDDDFEPRARGGGGAGGRSGKRKKHAPMTKLQQEEQLRALQGKLQEFSNAATSGSESPSNQANAQPESSGDEEEEESEEE